MKLGSTVLFPSRSRKPYFDGWDTSSANFQVSCESCRAVISVTFPQILAGAWGWKEKFGPEAAVTIRNHFGLDTGWKALDGGWPSISQVNCPGCGASHVFYADFDEYSNSIYRIVAQGLAAYVV
jgi:hypothetical protein